MPIQIPALPGQPRPAAGPTAEAALDGGPVDPRDPRPSAASFPSTRWYGVYPALVRENRDPDGLGRVKIQLPWAQDAGGSGSQKPQRYEVWARLATLAAGANRGSWFLPEIDDEVLVAFEAGHPSRPIVVGALWNGKDVPPVTADAQNTIKVLRTRSGSEIRFDDRAGDERVEIRTAAGPSITLTTAAGGTVVVTDGQTNAVTVSASGVTVQAAATVRIMASAITLSAGSIALDSPLVQCGGIIQGTTLVVQNVVASSYTPGAGNVW